MRNLLTYIFLLSVSAAFVGCTADIDVAPQPTTATTTYVEASLGEREIYATRATKNTYDGWTISTFGQGDGVGMYATTGRQNPEDLDDYSLPIWNEFMSYEGRTGSYYRFGNAEVVMDPTKVSTTSGYNYSAMYYPYYPDMPDPNVYLAADIAKGFPLREVDPEDNNIEKCKDLMITTSQRIPLNEGVLRPTFKHSCFTLVIQRGDGFKDPEDPSIWVIMRNPLTDARITRYHYSNTEGEFQWTFNYIPEEGEEVMGRIIGDQPGFDVNKYAVWQTWEGNLYKGVESNYVLLPPKEVMFILIQDSYGDWHNVTDFYISGVGNKAGTAGNRYVINISLKGLDVVVRPMYIDKWDEELTITDDRKVGINNFGEYSEWVTAYNTYTANNRSSAYHETLLKYGDGIETDGRMNWRFYINSDIDFSDTGDSPLISSLEDILEGSSTYTNYSISNVKGDLIDKMTDTGQLRALDFKKLYVIQNVNSADFFGGLVNTMEGGIIENCNIINGVVVGNGPVGMLAGTITNGEIKDCNISGDVIGQKSYPVTIDGVSVDGLFGTINGTPVLTNVKTTGLKFILNN